MPPVAIWDGEIQMEKGMMRWGGLSEGRTGKEKSMTNADDTWAVSTRKGMNMMSWGAM